MRQPSQTLRLTAGAQKRPDNARRETRGRGRLSGDESALNWRMQHHPLGEDQPGLARIKIAGPEGGTPSSYPPSSYPMRAADTVDALEKKGRIDHRAAAAARKFEATFQRASLQGLANRDLRQMPGSHDGGGSEPHSILHSRDDVWAAMEALGGIGTPGANIVWDVLGLGMTIKGHAQRCQFGRGRSLDPMTATGILVQACFSLAVHYGK